MRKLLLHSSRRLIYIGTDSTLSDLSTYSFTFVIPYGGLVIATTAIGLLATDGSQNFTQTTIGGVPVTPLVNFSSTEPTTIFTRRIISGGSVTVTGTVPVTGVRSSVGIFLLSNNNSDVPVFTGSNITTGTSASLTTSASGVGVFFSTLDRLTDTINWTPNVIEQYEHLLTDGTGSSSHAAATTNGIMLTGNVVTASGTVSGDTRNLVGAIWI